MDRPPYPTDLTDQQWKILEPFIPLAKPGGRPRTTDMREVMNAILYLTRGGIAWRLLPHEFLGWSTVYHYFRRWRLCGVWRKIHDALHAQVSIWSVPGLGIGPHQFTPKGRLQSVIEAHGLVAPYVDFRHPYLSTGSSTRPKPPSSRDRQS